MKTPDIEALRREGRLISSGSFTLDAQRARSVLGQYALPEKAMYVLKLVQWAVAAGASRVELGLKGARFWFRHDGTIPTSERFQALLSFAATPASRAERHLQVALATLLTLEPRELGLADGLLAAVGARIQRFSAAARSVHGLLTFDIGLNTWHDLAAHLGRSELALLRTHCEGGSVPIWVNGFCVNRPSLGLASRATLLPDGRSNLTMAETQLIRKGYFFLNRNPQEFSIAAPAIAWNKGARWYWSDTHLEKPLQISHRPPQLPPAGPLQNLQEAHPVPLLWHGVPMLSADLAISCAEDSLERTHRIYHFYDGVLVGRAMLPAAKGSWRTFTACPELTLDASGLALVHDQRLEALHRRIDDIQRLM